MQKELLKGNVGHVTMSRLGDQVRKEDEKQAKDSRQQQPKLWKVATGSIGSFPLRQPKQRQPGS